MPGARIPGTAIPTFGSVSDSILAKVRGLFVEMRKLTVANDNSVDDEGQEGLLVGSCVVLQEGSGVVITDGGAIGTLSGGNADGRGHSESFEEHDVKLLVVEKAR